MPPKKHRASNRPVPTEDLEHSLRTDGFGLIAGLDEVGRGAIAGPLVVGAIILPPGLVFEGLADSKLLTARGRERLAPILKQAAISFALGVVEVIELNQLGLGPSLHLAARRAIDGLSHQPDFVISDGQYPFRGINRPQRAVVKADQFVRCVAAASVIAKVYRDHFMDELHAHAALAAYGFIQNKGYPSVAHREALIKFGPSDQHRQNFRPVADLLLPN